MSELAKESFEVLSVGLFVTAQCLQFCLYALMLDVRQGDAAVDAVEDPA